MDLKKTKLIIGIGNPSKKYENTYHNLGILFVDQLKDIKNRHFLKSSVFMNESGSFVKEMMQKHKINPNELVIVHDDSDIELGKVKLSFGSSSGGHNGVKDIIDKLATEDFYRLRIGIRNINEVSRKKALEFVLSPISDVNMQVFEKIFKEVSEKYF